MNTKKRVLLVAPEFRSPVWDVSNLPLLQKKALMAPLQLATVAGLTPNHVEVDLWDEELHGRIDDSTEFEKEYNLVGITGYTVHLRRAKEIAQVFRQREIPIAIGGVGASSAPERYRDVADILFVGEAELTWPRFIADWESGSYRHEYTQAEKPDLAISPIPKWHSVADHMDSYAWGAVQTTRGCPFDCEFCDVVHLHGRRPRHKPIEKVLTEVSALERLGMETVFFCDDNFIGNRCYAEELLLELISLNRSFRSPLAFFTQLGIDVAKDEKLLELLADANFEGLLIGIETPNIDSLIESNKRHNLRSDLIADCKKVMSYGIPIQALMMVGFDHDTPLIFDQQFEFHQEACIPLAMTNILKAPHGTRLWSRVLKEGRLLNIDAGLYDDQGFFSRDTQGASNIIPKRMTRAELFSGYMNLTERIYDWDNFAARVTEFISNVKRQPKVEQETGLEQSLAPDLNAFILSLDEKAQRAILSILLHTHQHAPSMMHKVLGLIGLQYLEAATLPFLREAIVRQIEYEESVDIRRFIVKSEV